MSETVNVKEIEEQIEARIKRVDTLKNKYKGFYENMKEIEKEITIEAGGIAALRAIVETQDAPTAEGDAD